jgi:anti-anti-sigma factor
MGLAEGPVPAEFSKTKVERRGGIVVVRFADPKIRDEETVATIAGELNRAIAREKPPKLVIDFSGVQALPSFMFGSLITLHEAIEARKGQLRLAAVAPSLRQVFASTRLDQMLTILPTVDEAVAGIA